MYPTLRNGDVLLLVSTDPQHVRIGDLVSFTIPSTPELITHRVIAIHSNHLVARGDRDCGRTVESVPFGAIAGRVRLVERSTRLVDTSAWFRRVAYASAGHARGVLRRWAVGAATPLRLRLQRVAGSLHIMTLHSYVRVFAFRRPNGIEFICTFRKDRTGARSVGSNHGRVEALVRFLLRPETALHADAREDEQPIQRRTTRTGRSNQ